MMVTNWAALLRQRIVMNRLLEAIVARTKPSRGRPKRFETFADAFVYRDRPRIKKQEP